jgi:hypothetical protein
MADPRFVATEAGDGAYIDMICDAYRRARPTSMFAAIAYATHGGVAELSSRLEAMDGWSAVRKRWLVGIDFCRSDPVALEYLNRMPRSEARVFDGRFVVKRDGCVPRVSYHPKLYGFSRNRRAALVAGSGNLSKTGLCVGVEAGMSLANIPAGGPLYPQAWFDRQWRQATRLADIAAAYSDQYADLANRLHPAPTEDDAAPESAGARGQLTASQLRKLAVCDYLWIDAGQITRNRGPVLPGNQLMLKRNTRVFFGFPARDLEPDTAVGHVAVEYAGAVRDDCSLRFSNNSMDVLTLPVPGDQGPPTYDNKTLCFERIGIRRFRLTVGSGRDASRWKRESKAVDGDFQMGSGREWGVF